MDGRRPRRALWQGQQAARRLGVSGLLGLGCLLMAALGALFVLRPAERTLRHAQRVRVEVAQAHARRRPRRVHAVTLPALPPVAAIPQLLTTLTQLAHREGVVLARGSYRLTPVGRGSRLMRLQTTVPVRADYPQLRAFIAADLAQFPMGTLDGFTFTRGRIGTAQVRARLTLSFYLRANR